MGLLEAVVLGIVQGLTEFLPISSSGHLVLGEFLLGAEFNDLSFEVFLHFGTLLSVVIVFRRAIWSILAAVRLKIKSALGLSSSPADSENWRLLWLIIVGSLPAGVAGVLFRNLIDKSFSSASFAAGMLLFTGTVLLLTGFFATGRGRLNFLDATMVGLGQALAMFPGISRSGMTISAGIFRGVERSVAAEFSFLLSLPAILGASLVELREVAASPHLGEGVAVYLTGAATAFAVGYAAIRFLLKMIKKGKFHYFAYYCFAVGLFFLILLR